MTPFNFGFVEAEVAVYQHGNTTIYDTNFNQKFEIPVYSNGFKNFIIRLPNGDYGIFGKVYEEEGRVREKQYKVSKKSLQKYTPKLFVDQSNHQVIGGFMKGGMIVIYDSELVPINEIQLDKFEVMVHLNVKEKRAFTFNRKLGAVSVYAYPTFEKEKVFKVNKLNNQFEFSLEGEYLLSPWILHLDMS
ncbi:MAG: hypothetical protein AAF985_20045 [Bacteroidota bacterium]